MEQETLLMDKQPTFTYKIGRHKGAVASSLVAVMVAYAVVVLLWLYTTPSLATLVSPLLFLAVGWLHLLLVHRRLAMLTATQRWFYTGFMAATVLLLFSCSAIWNVNIIIRHSLAAAAAFLLPFVLAELWRLYVKISYANTKTWQASNTDSDYPDIYLTGIPVRFKILPSQKELPQFSVQFNASGRMALSEVFVDLMQKQTKKGLPAVPLGNGEPEAGRWVFFTRDTLLWKRILDPAHSIRKNGLKDDAVIYVKRVTNDDFYSSKEQMQ